MPSFKRSPAIQEALARLDTPESEAEFLRQGRQDAEELAAQSGPGRRSIAFDPYAMAAFVAGSGALSEATAPMKFGGNLGPPTESEQRAAAATADRNVLEVVARQQAIYRRADAVRAIHFDPDRAEADRIWNAYMRQINSVAFTHGNKVDAFARRFWVLVGELEDAQSYDDDAGVRAGEARLFRHTGRRWPQLPEAAWVQADLLPEAVRQEELDRLEVKYGPRRPSANGTAGKTRGRRSSRPMQALAIR